MKSRGDLFEQRAVNWVEGEGWSVVARNYRTQFGEIDIIAIKDEVLHFIEVKSGSSYDPLYNITPKKLQHIINTAHRFMQKKNLDLAFQIDAISVQENRCELIENITI